MQASSCQGTSSPTKRSLRIFDQKTYVAPARQIYQIAADRQAQSTHCRGKGTASSGELAHQLGGNSEIALVEAEPPGLAEQQVSAMGRKRTLVAPLDE